MPEAGIIITNGVTVDLNRWKNKDLREYTQKGNASAQDYEFFPLFAKCVTAWPWAEFDPSKAEDYNELSIVQWAVVIRAVTFAVNQIFRPNQPGDVPSN